MPAGSGLRRVITFQNRSSIDITFLLPAELAQKLIDFSQFALDQIVIVIAPGIPRDSACSGTGVACLGGSLKIIHRKHNDRACASQNLLRITAFFFSALHVTHFAVSTFIQPISEFICVWRGAAGRDAAGVKTNSASK